MKTSKTSKVVFPGNSNNFSKTFESYPLPELKITSEKKNKKNTFQFLNFFGHEIL